MKHLGDITKLDGAKLPPVDIITGGSPCQDLSVAGKREGLAGERSGLFMEQVRNGINATSWGFEPGAARRLDAENRFNEELSPTLRAEMGDNQPAVVYGISSYDSNAMKSGNPHSGIYEADTARTLDSLGGNPACNQGGMAVVCVAPHVTPKIDEKEVAFTLNQRDYKEPQVIAFAQNQRDEVRDLGDKSASLAAEPGVHQQTYVLEGNGARPSHKGDGYAESDTMYTLNATEYHAVCYSEPTLIEMTSTKNTVVEDGISPTLTARMGTGGNQVNAICIGNGQANQSIGNVVNTISSRDYKGGQCVMTYQERTGTLSPGQHAGSYNGQDASNDMLVSNGYIVRRLTPLECERLQGFPDGWTDIGDWTDSKGKKHKASDSPRYKALGNSIALPFWEWLAGRMVKSLGVENPTMGSLFDGIGGFPLVFSRNGCFPTWASEVDEFCIAVTKKRF